MFDWIYKSRVNILHQMTHSHFDFTTRKVLKMTPSDGKHRNKSTKMAKNWHSFESVYRLLWRSGTKKKTTTTTTTTGKGVTQQQKRLP